MTRWLWPGTVDEAIELRAELGDDAMPIAGGTFIGVLAQTGFLELPESMIALGRSPASRASSARATSSSSARWRRTPRSSAARWCRTAGPALAACFGVVANVRVRNAATLGGVLADADYASDPPSMLLALGARVEIAGPAGVRELGVGELILGHYETAIEPDELIVRVRIPRPRRRRT